MTVNTFTHSRAMLIPIIMMLLLSLSGGLAGAQASQSDGLLVSVGSSAENGYATCTATSSTRVTCTLTVVANQSSLDLTKDILSLAQEVNADIEADTVMWIQAWGGKGGKGEEEVGGWTGGWGGDGGFAQTITTISDYQTKYNTTAFHYFIAGKGGDNATTWGGGGGAASTIVAPICCGFSASNVLLIAGGGGGGNAGWDFHDGQNGGHGGSAQATTAKSVYGAGQDVNGNGGTARGGSHYGPGQGSPAINQGGQDWGSGGDGFGGYGGGGNITYVLYGWMNGDAGTSHAGGGVSSDGPPGVPSGGGYGGGGFNACGGNNPNSGGHWNCAGPGGGAYAAGITRIDGSAPSSYIPDTGAAMINLVFNLAPASFSFAAPVANPFSIGKVQYRSSPTFVDIDGNGTQDLFVGTEIPSTGVNRPTPQPTIYFKNEGTTSHPTFASGVSNPFGLESLANGGSPTFADIDGDGDFDAFIGSGHGITVFFENEGSKTNPKFASGVGNPFGLISFGSQQQQDSGIAWVAPTFVDIDDDGLLDAFIGAPDGTINYFKNEGSTTSPKFATPSSDAFGISKINDGYAKPAFVDIDGDGDLDLFIGGQHGSTGYYQNIGTAKEPKFLPSADVNPPTINIAGITNVGGYAAPTFVDINDDGAPDAFIGASSGNSWYYRNNTSTVAEPPVEEGEPVLGYDATPGVAITIAEDASQQKAIVYGSEAFDASQVNQDIISFEDWSGNQLATVIRPFWTSATGDLNGDGYLDRTLTFYSNDPTLILDEANDGKELCVQGVTFDGVEFRGCAFVE